MKKSIFLSFASIAMVLASCSDDLYQVPFVPGNSEVEIVLSSGAPSLSTRAAIENNDAIEGMGIYCVAKSSNNEGETVINWNNDSDEDPAIIMNNVKANKAGDAVDVRSEITWEGKRYYYPAFLRYNYDFYGYYPHSEEAKINEDGTKVSVDYTIDGETDIIWGVATSDEPLAYSANYFRQEEQKSNPNLKLDHMLTRLIFQVEQAEAEEGETVIPMTLDKVELLDVPTSCTLNIADRGTVYETPAAHLVLSGEAKADLALNSEALPCDTKVENGKLGEPINLGSGLMIYPQKEFVLRLAMTQHDEAEPAEPTEPENPDVNPDEPTEPENPDVNPDEPTESENPDVNPDEPTDPENPGEEVAPESAKTRAVKTDVKDIPLALADGASFEAGKAYIITIKVNGPRKIEITATLTPWVKVNGPTIEF